MNSKGRTWPLVIAACIMGYIFVSGIRSQKTPPPPVSYSAFLANVEGGNVKSVEITEKPDVYVISVTAKNGTVYLVQGVKDPELVSVLKKNKVILIGKPIPETGWFMVLASWIIPIILFFVIWSFVMKRAGGGAGGIGKLTSFGQSRAKLLTENRNPVTFKDVAGVEEAKEELREVIDFLKNPTKFTKLGGRIPKGCLLIGPPGTGKTLLARAVAGEAGTPFFSISGSEFVEMFVGVGASRVRDLFLQGKKSAPCIIFIDEIDAVGARRGGGMAGAHEERQQTLNQLLVEMDGFEANLGVVIMAATNRPDVLDSALLRAGRFDRRVVVPLPDVKGREGILAVHARKVLIAPDIDLSVLARGTPGFSGADLENLVNEAALAAARNNRENVTMADFDFAKDKVSMGSERKSAVISEKEKKITAYHETGHALTAKSLPGTDPVHKVTIIPRGMALGLTQQLPIDDKHTYSKNDLKNTLSILLGGRVAEEITSGDITTGAANDLEKVTDIARKMVCEWGMSENMGPRTFGKKNQESFLGENFSSVTDYSPDTAVRIDQEVNKIVTESLETTRKILKSKILLLEKIAGELLVKETLGGAELDAIIKEFNEDYKKQESKKPA